MALSALSGMETIDLNTFLCQSELAELSENKMTLFSHWVQHQSRLGILGVFAFQDFADFLKCLRYDTDGT